MKMIGAIWLFLIANLSYGQTIAGPDTANPGDLVSLYVENLPAGILDLKICCAEHKKGEGYSVFKSVDDQLVIQVLSKTPTTFTFIVAGNKDNKTILLTKYLVIGGTPNPNPNPNPGPSPGPTPTPPTPGGPYTARFQPLYMVSPDATTLDKLISIYTGIGNTTYKNYQEAGIALESQTKPLGTAMLNLRQECTKVLVENLGLDTGDQWDAAKFKKTFTDIAQSLSGLKK